MESKAAYEEVQTKAFGSLVRDGVYSKDFDHAPQAQLFFHNVMSGVLLALGQKFPDGLHVMDCGCGNGAWLDYLTDMKEAEVVKSVHGFDLTTEMIEVAIDRLSPKTPSSNMFAANILDGNSYKVFDSGAGFNLLYTYDVIQQLPRKHQFKAIESMLEHLSDGGVAVIFDNDAKSTFGRKMGRKKFLTRYFGLRLVPRYYCNAHYPPMMEFAERLAEDGQFGVSIQVSSNGMKRALVLSRN